MSTHTRREFFKHGALSAAAIGAANWPMAIAAGENNGDVATEHPVVLAHETFHRHERIAGRFRVQ